jgi:hypothetical protein
MPSKLYVRIGEKNDAGGNDGAGVVPRLLGTLGGLIAFRINPPPPVKEYKISVDLPVCENHRGSKTLRPLYIDYRRYRITVPVHQAFIERWKKGSA